MERSWGKRFDYSRGGEVGQWGTVRNRGVVAMEVMTGLTVFGSEAEWLK